MHQKYCIRAGATNVYSAVIKPIPSIYPCPQHAAGTLNRAPTGLISDPATPRLAGKNSDSNHLAACHGALGLL
jgi:hypothetical protein